MSVSSQAGGLRLPFQWIEGQCGLQCGLKCGPQCAQQCGLQVSSIEAMAMLLSPLSDPPPLSELVRTQGKSRLALIFHQPAVNADQVCTALFRFPT